MNKTLFPARIEIYSWHTCPYCVRAKMLLDHKGVSYTEYFVEHDADATRKMITRAQGRRSVPQIFINDRAIGGYQELAALHQGGTLDELLQQPPPKENDA